MTSKKIKGITIEIGGETTKLQESLKGVNKQARDLQSELRDTERLLKLDPSNTVLLEQKQKLLAESVANTKSKLDTLREAEKQVQVQFERGEVGEEQYRALQREVIRTEQELKKAEKAAKEFGSVLAQQIKKSGEDMKAFGDKVSGVGKSMSKAVTAPIMGIAAASQVAFKEVDAALDAIATNTGATGAELDRFHESFRTVYGSMPVDAEAAGSAIGEVNTQYALTGEVLEKASSQFLRFSQINGQDVTGSVQGAKRAMEAYQLTAEDLDGVLDAVTRTAQGTGVSTDKLFDSVARGAPQLRELGLDFAQSAEMMGRLEQKGIESTKALSYLARAQVSFAKDGKTMSQGLESLVAQIENSTLEAEKLTLASEYFGTKGASFMLDAIQRGALDFEDFQGAAEKAAGAVADTFEATLDPVDRAKVAMNNLKMAGTDISVAIQKTLAPMIESVVEKLQKLVTWFSNLDEGTKQTIVIIAMIVAAIGPLLVIVGMVISAFGSLTIIAGGLGMSVGALVGPIAIAIAAITAIIAIGVALYKNWDTIKEHATQLMETIDEKFEAIRKIIVDTWERAKKAVNDAIRNIAQTVKDTLSGLVTAVFTIGSNIVRGLWDGISSMAGWVKDKISGFVDGIVGGMKSLLGISSPSKVFAGIGEDIGLGLIDGIMGKRGAVELALSGLTGTSVSTATSNTYNNGGNTIVFNVTGGWDEIERELHRRGVDL